MPLGSSAAASATVGVECRFSRLRGVPKTTLGQFARQLIAVLEYRLMTPEFYIVLKNRELDDQLADAVFEAGFDDSELTARGEHAAIWICHRAGELTDLVRQALTQARA